MGNFNRNNRSGDRHGGGRSSFGGRDFGRGDGGRKEMFDAVCNKCGADCRVPFKPSGIKPVYCSDCFDNMDVRDSGFRNDRDDRNDRNDRFARNDRPSFRPQREDRPRFASAPQNNSQIQDLQAELTQVNAKLDKVLFLLRVVEEAAQHSAEVKQPVETKQPVEVETSSDAPQE